MKRIKIVCLTLVFCIALTGCAANKGSNTKEDITSAILAQFDELTKIPRPSHHEEQISAYLKKWAEDRQLNVTQDRANNIIIEVPATKGYEKLPLTILQGHMDMVFAKKEGLDLDPLTTTINVVNDGTYLKSDGNTSLGADNGIGLSTILSIADGKMDHGPLRLIVTTDEDSDMTGSHIIDPKYFSDAAYLINVDSETEGEATVSSASMNSVSFVKEYKAKAQTKANSLMIQAKGLSGGHSGVDIDKGHLNAAVAMGYILNSLYDAGIDFELTKIDGGTAYNAIMYSASALICINDGDIDKAKAIVNDCYTKLKSEHAETDPNMEINIADANNTDGLVLPKNERNSILTFFKEYKNGIRTMSSNIPNLVECSVNLGIIHVNPNALELVMSSRSSSPKEEELQMQDLEEIAESADYTIQITHVGDAWEYKPDSKLEKVFRESYRKLFNEDIKITALHAGLECGTFAMYNNKLDIISIGPTIENAHSTKECVDIASIEMVWDLLAEVLINL